MKKAADKTLPPEPPSPASDLWSHTKRESDLEIAPGIRATERHEEIIPYRNRTNENAIRAAQSALCRDPLFFAQVQNLRNHVLRIQSQPEQSFGKWLDSLHEHDTEGFSRLRKHAKGICNYWGLDAWEWVTWLARDWDPGKDQVPRLEPGEALAFVAPWTVDSYSHRFNDGSSQWQTKYVLLTLRPGISRAQAGRALREALLKLPTHKPQGRPSISERERNELHGLFARLKPGKRRNPIVQVMEALKQRYKGAVRVPGSLQDITQSTVTKEYYNWKQNDGEKTKERRRYSTQKSDRRIHSASTTHI